MKWSKLLSEQRLGEPISAVFTYEYRYPSTEFEKDYRRIISSASFRRLQDKTQVFPLDQSDFVRTRLTHSYETAMIAKSMGNMLQKLLLEEKNLDEDDRAVIGNISDILSCAGLLHDIGNPPFGHFGEEIIKKWFKINLSKISINNIHNIGIVDSALDSKPIYVNEILNNRYIQDLQNFDGNAQALRVLSRLHFIDSDYGFNLTSAVLNTLIKYPSASNEIKNKDDEDYSILRKKMGYSYNDESIFNEITYKTGAGKCRHPLAFILEAADDIAYKTADIEDGFKKGLFSLDELIDFINSEITKYELKGLSGYPQKYVKQLFNQLSRLRQKGREQIFEKQINDVDLYAVQNWVFYAQEWFMYCAIYGFDKHYEEIMDGTYMNDLFYETNHEVSVEIIDKVMAKFIFPNRNIVKLELAANTILDSLLDKFTKAALFHDGKYISENCPEIQAYQKLYGLISDNYCENYKLSLQKGNAIKNESDINSNIDENIQYDIYLRLLLVVDYISGMTDSYAKSLYQELNGIYGLSGIY